MTAYATLTCALRNAKTLSLALVSAAVVLLGAASSANAVVCDGTNCYYSLSAFNAALTAATGKTVSISISTPYDSFLGAYPVPPPNSSPDDTETFINTYTTPSWNVDLTFQSGDDPLGADTKSGTITDVASQVWVLKFDSALIALLFNTAVSSLTFSGLHAGLSHYDLGSVVPLPPAVILFGTALVGMGLLGRRRKKALAQAI
jgi:hypothetical protein